MFRLSRRQALAWAAGLPLWARAQRPAAGTGIFFDERGPREYGRNLETELRALMEQRRQRRQSLLAAVEDAEGVKGRQQSIRETLWRILGGPFEREALNPTIQGTRRGDGFRIELVIYESRPRLFVTANLYLPEGGSPPYPAILAPLGHTRNGKAAATYQIVFQSLARKGFVVLAYDPFGQGERIEYPSREPGVSRLGAPTREHSNSGYRLLLTGHNFSSYLLWDGVRGIDYLLTREEVDPRRIGCAGQSGGGTMTMFLAALEPRIQAAVVCQGHTENFAREEFLPPGPVADAEQNIIPGLASDLDRFDLLHAFAPRPLMIQVALHDAGSTYSPGYARASREGYQELRRTYRLLGAEENVALVESPLRHGWGYELRRETYGWFQRWLGAGPPRDSGEPGAHPYPDKDLQCTHAGSVAAALGGETSFTLARARAREILPGAVAVDLRARARELLALPAQANTPAAKVLSRTGKAGWEVEEFELEPAAGVRLPGWLFRAGEGRQPAVLFVSEQGKDSTVSEGGLGQAMAVAGFRFAAVDVRGRGACAPEPPPSRWHRHLDLENSYAISYLVCGRPLLGRYVEDLLAAAAWLRARDDVNPGRVWLLARGSLAVAGLFALAIDQNWAGGILEQGLLSYSAIARTQDWNIPYELLLHGVMEKLDLPHLAASVAPRPLLFLRPADPQGRQVSESAAREEYRLAAEAYAAAGASERLRFQPRAATEIPAEQLAGQYVAWMLGERR